VEKEIKAALRDEKDIDIMRLRHTRICPPPLEVCKSSDRLGVVMEALCQRGGADEEFCALLRSSLNDEDVIDNDSLHRKSSLTEAGKTCAQIFGERNPLPAFLNDSSLIAQLTKEVVQEFKLTNRATERRDQRSHAMDVLQPLGRRGRDYDDVWREEDFIEKSGLGARGLRPLRDWSELLNNYSDSHDGYYREWAIVAASEASTGRIGKPTMILVPPPVPVHQQHPGSWGIGARQSLKQLNVALIHPASCSRTVVQPPGVSSNILSRDLDDLDLDYERLKFSLVRQEMLNAVRLDHLSRLAKSDVALQPIKDKILKLEQDLVSVNNAIVNSQRPVKPKMTRSSSISRDVSILAVNILGGRAT
jgi:hypothetical protein